MIDSLDQAIYFFSEQAKLLRQEDTIAINEKMGYSREDILETADDDDFVAELLKELKKRREEDEALKKIVLRKKKKNMS